MSDYVVGRVTVDGAVRHVVTKALAPGPGGGSYEIVGEFSTPEKAAEAAAAFEFFENQEIHLPGETQLIEEELARTKNVLALAESQLAELREQSEVQFDEAVAGWARTCNERDELQKRIDELEADPPPPVVMVKTTPTFDPDVFYPDETLDIDGYDDGTMPNNVEALREVVVGHKIVSAVKDDRDRLVITLDNGKKVTLADTADCCAYTDLNNFFCHPNSVDHMIMGVGTTDKFTVWHIYADFGDIMQLSVGWSGGNLGYYGYGFSIQVEDVV